MCCENPSGIVPLLGFADPVSCLTHLGGAAIFAVLGVRLLARGRGHRRSLGVFVGSAVVLLSLSGVYHLLGHGGTARGVVQRLDHAAIFLLISGTFTAVHGILFRGLARWGILVIIWLAAVSGITLKSIFFHDVPETWGLSIYLLMGWIGSVSAVMVWRRYGFGLVQPLLAGGLAYTAGAAIDFGKAPTLIQGMIGPHELFHFAVLAGLGWHWRCVVRCLDGG